MKTPFALIVAAAVALALGGCAKKPSDPAGTAVATPDPAHAARTALDWAGAYRGVLPCADCEGIETLLVLSRDGTYRAQARYLGKSEERFTEQGSFSWDAAGNSITLQGAQPVRYAIGENRIVRLSLDGSRNTGPLADRYVLERLTLGVTGTRWVLVELNGHKLPALDRSPYLLLEPTEKRVNGFGGCNAFGGGYELDEAHLRLRFDQVASTMRACLSGMAEEKELHEVLRRVDSYAIDGTTLMLHHARMAPLARFEAEEEQR